MKLKEILATLSVVISILAMPLVINWYHTSCVLGAHPEGTRVITLSGMAEGGIWTLERVNGANYWWKKFEPGTIYLDEGDSVVLRLESTDVHHRFYCPELDIEPIEVEPGHVATTKFAAEEAGVYRYYCTSMCGECHFYMQGWIVVTAEGQTPLKPGEVMVCKHEYKKPPEEDMIAWGQYLYYSNGCITCHGDKGKGGVANPNYVKDEIPAHNTLADKLWLREKEHAETFVEMLKARVNFEELDEQPDIPLFNLVLTQYHAAKDLIKNGKHCAKADADGPEPPRQMVSWEALLTDRDIDSIIAYLITLYQWDEDEEE
ncbi:MAG: c-type cytochrome [Planctomycetota bacterium]|jgi:plastocyanin